MLFAGSSRADIVEILQVPNDWVVAEEKQNELDYAASCMNEDVFSSLKALARDFKGDK